MAEQLTPQPASAPTSRLPRSSSPACRLPASASAAAASPTRSGPRPWPALVVGADRRHRLCRRRTWFGLPPSLAAHVALAAAILVTGSLHEDGVADVADGFGGGNTRERKLEIMKRQPQRHVRRRRAGDGAAGPLGGDCRGRRVRRCAVRADRRARRLARAASRLHAVGEAGASPSGLSAGIGDDLRAMSRSPPRARRAGAAAARPGRGNRGASSAWRCCSSP